MPSALIYGDSNTHGTPPLSVLGEEGRHAKGSRWPDVMAEALGPKWDVIAEGLPGRTTVHDDPIEGAYRNGLALLPAALHTHKPLDLLVVMLGTNDLKSRFSATAFEIAEGAGRLAEAAMASGVVSDVLLIAPPAVKERGCLADMFAGAEPRGRDVAPHMQATAERFGCRFFDAGQVIETDPLDGVHFGVEAHDVLGRAVADAVRDWC